MSTASEAATPGSVLDRVERTAWRVPLPTRRLFLTLALVAVVSLVVSGLVAGWVASRNAATIADAREEGLELAIAVTDYRTNLGSADALAAETLIAGLEDQDSRTEYDNDLLQASRALTDAGLVATDDDRDDIGAMGDGLISYASLVSTARANARQGNPVAASYLEQARADASDDLVPLADRRRREGERRIAQASNSVTGPLSLLAAVALVLGLAALLGCAALVAGRTRRVAHPALVAAAVVMAAALAFVIVGTSRQGGELADAAGGDIDAYLTANEAASALSQLRVTELSAVAARGSGAPLYRQVEEDGNALLTTLDEARESGAAPPGSGELSARIETYLDAVAEVEATDLGGDNPAAGEIALSTDSGGSGRAYLEAFDGDVPDASTDGETPSETGPPPDPGSAIGNVDAAALALEDGFDAAASADIPPALPVLLAAVAAACAGGGILARGRRYR